MIRTILNRWSDAVIWSGEAETVKAAIHAAFAAGANLRGANLRGANLTDANLRGANLTGANLRGANLTGANLTDANLTDANLTGANLRGANLRGANLRDANLTGANLTDANLTDANLRDANLTGANLRDANLTGANLTGANLTDANLTDANLTDANLREVRDDLWAVLSSAPSDVPALIAALKAGRVDGSTYSGECACLVGTIANARHCTEYEIPGLSPNGSRPAERFFLGINMGDTPETSQFAKLAVEWCEDWLTRMQIAFGAVPA